ncbi:MAG: electron transfer flavoprotein subunit beta/FixA family protein [Candidatus Bathyarchaeia archaeon]
MEIMVLVKPVPLVEGVTLTIKGADIAKETLKFAINELDDYALEKALLLKEKHGGKVTLLTVAPEKFRKHAEQIIREGYAKGADEAVAVLDPAFDNLDSYAAAKILADTVKTLKYDLILSGVQATDDGSAAVGTMVAEILGIPHAALVISLEPIDGKALKVRRELEEGVEEIVELPLPALLSIQSGTDTPRYAAFAKIRAAMKKEIKVLTASGVGLQSDAVSSLRKVGPVSMQVPTVAKEAEMLTGTPEEEAAKLAQIIKEKGHGRA